MYTHRHTIFPHLHQAQSSAVPSLAHFLAGLLVWKKQKKTTSHQVHVSTRINQPLSTIDWKPASQHFGVLPETWRSKKRLWLSPPPCSLWVLPGCHDDTLPRFPTTAAAAGKLFDVLHCSHCRDGEAVCQTGQPSGKLYSIQTRFLESPSPLSLWHPVADSCNTRREEVGGKKSNTHFRETGRLLKAAIRDAGVTFSVVGLDWSHMRLTLFGKKQPGAALAQAHKTQALSQQSRSRTELT